MAGRDLHIGVMLERLNWNMEAQTNALLENARHLEFIAQYYATNLPPPTITASDTLRLQFPTTAATFAQWAAVGSHTTIIGRVRVNARGNLRVATSGLTISSNLSGFIQNIRVNIGVEGGTTQQGNILHMTEGSALTRDIPSFTANVPVDVGNIVRVWVTGTTSVSQVRGTVRAAVNSVRFNYNIEMPTSDAGVVQLL